MAEPNRHGWSLRRRWFLRLSWSLATYCLVGITALGALASGITGGSPGLILDASLILGTLVVVGLLEQRDRVAQVLRRLVGAGEVVLRRQRVAMVAAAVWAGGTATHGVMALRLLDESVSATRTEPHR
jgi:hypothetical protein